MTIRYFFAAGLSFLMLSTSVYSQEVGCSSLSKPQLARALGAPALAQWLTWEVASCEDLVIYGDSVAFKLRPATEPVHGGIRSEVAVNFPYQEGDTVRYSWEMKFPADFTGDSLNRWWALAQWHDQPDRRIGETWANFPPRSPPVSLYIEQRNGVAGMGVIYNGTNKRSWAKLPLGEWIAVTVSLHWSTQEDGQLLFFVDKFPEFSLHLHGNNMQNSYQHYLKLGQYRHSGIKIKSSVLFRKLKIKLIE